MIETIDKKEALVAECERQEENCQYTAAGLYTWQKRARFWRAVYLVVPIILSGFATSEILGKYLGPIGQFTAASAGIIAGFFPAIFIALNMDMKVVEIGRSAAEFTNLRDRFRQLGKVRSKGELEQFEASFEALMDRMDAVRSSSPPLPDAYFRVAQKKIKGGDYSYDRDASAKPTRVND